MTQQKLKTYNRMLQIIPIVVNEMGFVRSWVLEGCGRDAFFVAIDVEFHVFLKFFKRLIFD